MAFVVETTPTLQAAEERLHAIVAALQIRPLDRVNVLVGSNLQRVYFRRFLAQTLGRMTANVRLFTPIDLAHTLRQHSSLPPRQPLPDGAEPILLDGIIRDLRAERRVRRLDPDVQGVAASVAGSLSDLREARLDPAAYAALLQDTDDPKLHDLAAIYERFAERMRPFQDRAGAYQDALDPAVLDDAVKAALADRPLLAIGIYDAPAIQIALLARCAAVVDTRVILVAPGDPEFAFARAFRDRLVAAHADLRTYTDEPAADADLESEFAGGPQHWFFSAPTRQAEAEEVVRRALWLARDFGISFDNMAVLHRLDAAADDLIAAAFQRAGIEAYRASGRPLRHTAPGRAALVLLDLLLRTPQRHRLLEFIASPALRDTLPPGAPARPLLWERISKQAGLVSGWERFDDQLAGYIDDQRRADHANTDYLIGTASELREVTSDLAQRAAMVDGLATWGDYAAWFLDCLDGYLRPPREAAPDEPRDPALTLRERVEALALLDAALVPVDRERFRLAAEQAIRRAVINDRRALAKGVFVGNVSAARSLRFDAVFLVECAERVFPRLIRQDPLLLDDERERLNSRRPHPLLPLKRDRQDEEEMLFQLVRQSARRFLTVSWARRTNTTGAPRLPSFYLLRALPHASELATLDELYEQGAIEKMPTRLAGAAPTGAQVAAGEWERTHEALDESDFRLAILEATPRAAERVLDRLWDGYRRLVDARDGRNQPRFTVWDGVLPPDALQADPLAEQTSPTALETYATCPYRYFVRQILHVHAVPEPGEALEMSPLDRGSMVHRILEDWVEEGRHGDWQRFVQDRDRLFAIAEREFERTGRGGLAGLPATWAIVQAEVRADLEELLRREQERARAGYRPLGVEDEFTHVPLELPNGDTLTFRGRIDRVDRGPEGLVAVDYKTGRAYKLADAYRNGSALQLPVYIQAVSQLYGEPPEQIAAEYWYATHKGHFERSGLRGADVFSDSLLWDTLDVITQGIRAGRFPPYPGKGFGGRTRPNCQFCDYIDVCTTDVDRRFEHKTRQDHETVREFLSLQARR